ncbi:MAG: phenylpyruvate tautomerase MIF-related protein [Pontiellaceae bacterium]|jgi:phenylpyruvate tautomerase|nr:phenylpyruvate tautomerase MIF-related protein [Pontiellaceae bacterium]
MPLIKIQTTREIPSSVLAGLSKIAAETIGKPETYVMVSSSSADLMMSGSAGHAAFVEVRSIGGLTRDVNEKLAAKICGLLEVKLQIPLNRVYLNFTEVPAAQWGWNGSLFG